jgi:beta-fructofuranosidase
MRQQHYRHRQIDPVSEGFRPIGGTLGDFCVVAHEGRYHFFAIERRLQEGTPFYPGHESFLCHASTADFYDWEVHDPVLWVRPGTWEAAHVWAPFILRHGHRYVMAYTGVNRHGSQDIGLAFSDDLFDWERSRTNPISPAATPAWASWRRDGIASCRDPHLFIYEDRVAMTYTANTREGASCIALASTVDLATWEDHGPILVGPAEVYEPRLAGGHPQGQLESSNVLHKHGTWILLVQESRRGTDVKNWIYKSEDIGHFDYASGREFWPGAYTVEVVQDHGDRSLLACTGSIRFGLVDWSQERPAARFVASAEELAAWLPNESAQEDHR